MDNLLPAYAKAQYEMVLDSRNVLFNYCKTISQKDLITEHNTFGRGGSMRNLLVHVANSYQVWVGDFALKKKISKSGYETINTIEEIMQVYGEVNLLVYEFIDTFKQSETAKIDYEVAGIKNSTTPFKLFTHVITHEYHHKGQVLSISRQLGYTPVDTDILR